MEEHLTVGRVAELAGVSVAALADIRGNRVVACEPAEAMRGRTAPGIAVIGGTAEGLPFRDGVIDAVWASQVIHHVVDLPGFARSLRRVLKPGGRVLLRGGFGSPDTLPLYRYFPLAWAPGAAANLPLPRITELFADVGLRLDAHVEVEQTLADDGDELLEKARTRSLSPLAGTARQRLVVLTLSQDWRSPCRPSSSVIERSTAPSARSRRPRSAR